MKRQRHFNFWENRPRAIVEGSLMQAGGRSAILDAANPLDEARETAPDVPIGYEMNPDYVGDEPEEPQLRCEAQPDDGIGF